MHGMNHAVLLVVALRNINVVGFVQNCDHTTFSLFVRCVGDIETHAAETAHPLLIEPQNC